MKNDLKLIRKINKKNDRKAADELISKYYKEIYTYIYKQLSEKESAMDLTQDIFISVLKGLHRFDGNKATFKTWIYKIATNKIIDYYRSNKYKYKNLLDDIDRVHIETGDDFVLNLEHREDIKKVQCIVNELDRDQQEIFRLKIFMDMQFNEISEILGMPISTIKSKYYRLIKKIRDEFNKKGDER
ncbi:MAG: sigma-70 family RNA polymerase sigma factor [Peptostreptococcaceae bacterium]